MQSPKQPYSSSLASIVCHWNPANLSQLAKSFSAACSKPQTMFIAYEHYKSYFEPLLFAEISAELQSAFDKYQRSNNSRPVKMRARREEAGSNPALVAVQRVTKNHTYGFGSVVDVEPCDKRGPVGCGDNDVAVVWLADKQPNSKHLRPTIARQIPNSAVLAVVVRAPGRNGCRLLLVKFPGTARSDLEEGKEPDENPIDPSIWVVLRLGSLTTLKREFDALQNIRSSNLLCTLLRPNQSQSLSENSMSEPIVPTEPQNASVQPAARDSNTSGSSSTRLEKGFTSVVASKLGLNASQTRAILHSSTCHSGFSVIQGPPGTGKTRTLIGLLNVIHMTQYHKYYEGLLASLDAIHGSVTRKRSAVKSIPASSEKTGDGSLLETMMMAMNKTVEASMTDMKPATPLTSPARRPRLLICAPSNSAVDEIVTRLMLSKFFDGHGRTYCPELARIGAGDKVSEAVKSLTAEGQAESFMERVCPEDDTGAAQLEAQKSYLSDWQKKCNQLLVQLERTPKTKDSSRAVVVDLHEKLERMERDLRRLSIAAAVGKNGMSRDDKLRLIARTYVEDAQLVFATLSGSASGILTKTPYGAKDQDACLFDTVVIDEAAQATETSCLIPMTLGCTRCLLVGDPQQLPATVLSSGAAGLAYGQSLLERVFRAGLNVQLLDTQYRMHPAISSFPRRYFYSGRLVDDETVQGEHRARSFHRDPIKPKLGPYVFLDISESEEQRSREDRSIFNQAEAELAAMIYMKLKKDYPGDTLFTPLAKMPGSVTGFGVVTPYKRQMQELRQSFERVGVPTGDVEIDTVDSFQGREKDVVVFSCVRTAAPERGIGFVRDVRRMNVGLTRARASLIILGSAQALAEGSKDWAELVEDADSRGCLLAINSLTRSLMPEIAGPGIIPSDLTNVKRVELESTGHGQANHIYGTSEKGRRLGSEPKRIQGNQRVDPRRRGAKSKTAGLKIPEEAMARHSEGTGAVIGFNGALNETVLNQIPVGNSGTGEDDGETRELLAQIREALKGAGFEDTGAVEETLREHLRKGGGLDIETVLAAAIAASGSTSGDKGKNGAIEPPNNVEPTKSIEINEHNEEDGAVTASQQGQVENTTGEYPLTSKADTIQEESEKKEPELVNSRELSDNKNKDEEIVLGKKKKHGEPSGWEMLFGGGVSNARQAKGANEDPRGTNDWGDEWEMNGRRKGKRTRDGWRGDGVGDDGVNEANTTGGKNDEPGERSKRVRGWHGDSGPGKGGYGRGVGRGREFGRGRGRGSGRGFGNYGQDVLADGERNGWPGGVEFGYASGGDNNSNAVHGSESGNNSLVGDGSAAAAAAAAMGLFGDPDALQAYQELMQQQQVAWQHQQAFQQQALQQQALLMHMSGLGGDGNKGGGWYAGGFDQVGGAPGFPSDGLANQGGNVESDDVGRGSGYQPWDRSHSRGRPFRGSRGRGRGRGGRRR